ncbi:MAG: hypothetical protein JW940_07320 [Polyangiaceae bacterium]|nr:hypothetical protein [Polyangiaceae bacterium]
MKAPGAFRAGLRAFLLVWAQLLAGKLVLAGGADPSSRFEPTARTAPDAQLGIQLSAVSLTETCEREFDAVSCEQGQAFAALELLARLRLNSRWTVGPFVAAGSELVSGGASDRHRTTLDSRFASLGAELRHFVAASQPLWLGARVGAFMVRDEESLEKSAAYVWAPGWGGALGYDLAVSESIDLTLSLRGDYLAFGGDEMSPDGSIERRSGFWVALGFGVLRDL